MIAGPYIEDLPALWVSDRIGLPCASMGSASDEISAVLNNLVARAHSLLADWDHRTMQEVEATLDRLRQALPLEPAEQELSCLRGEPLMPFESLPSTTQRLVRHCVPYDATALFDAPPSTPATWSRVFAVLAFSQIQQALRILTNPARQDEMRFPVVEAMEAISYAEKLQQYEARLAKQVSDGHKGPPVRNQKTDALKRTVWELDKKYRDMTAYAAAREILAELPPKADECLKGDTVQRLKRIAEWISKHRKRAAH